MKIEFKQVGTVDAIYVDDTKVNGVVVGLKMIKDALKSKLITPAALDATRKNLRQKLADANLKPMIVTAVMAEFEKNLKD